MTNGLLIAASAVVLAINLYIFVTLALGNWKMRRLPTDIDVPAGGWPTVSIIVPARNEAQHLEAALQSLLGLDYPKVDLRVIDDRSTDQTPVVLGRLAAQHPQLSIHRIDDLPTGWLGKNHALHWGSASAPGKLLLFTDADVMFVPSTLKQAVRVLVDEQLDHLTLVPFVRSPSFTVNLMIASFLRSFGMYAKPWRASNPQAKEAVGIGAFNLVRASAYRAISGHESIRLRPDDDMQLGKALKSAGCRQNCMIAQEQIWLDWYGTFGEMKRGLEKNVLSATDFRAVPLFAALGVLTLVDLYPWAASMLLTGPAQWLAGASVVLLLAGFARSLLQLRLPIFFAILQPIASTLLIIVFGRAAALTLIRRGIQWRDTFYALDDLRAAASHAKIK